MKIIGIIKFSEYYSYTADLFNKTKIMKYNLMYEYFTLILMKQYFSNNLPMFGGYYFVTNNFNHNYLIQYQNN